MLNHYKKTLISFFHRIQHLRLNAVIGDNECLRIQEDLIKKVLYIENKIRKQKKLIDDYTKKLKTVHLVRLVEKESKSIKDRIIFTQYKVDEYQRILTILKEIGDAIAFIFINKWDIKPLAFKEPPGFISGKKGFLLECDVLKEVFKKGKTGILNDITNCLRYGDVTLIIEKGLFIPIEVKSSHMQNDRTKRQLKRLEKITNYIHKDKTDELYGLKGKTVRKSVHSDEINYQDGLNRLIEKALITGTAYLEVEEGVYYYVTNEEKKEFLDEILKKIKGRLILEFVNNYKQYNTAYYPFTLSIRNPDALLKFYSGEFIIMVLIDTDVIYEKFKTKGLEIEFMEDEGWLILVKNHGRLVSKISNHFFGRVFSEFISLDWVLEECLNMQNDSLHIQAQ